MNIQNKADNISNRPWLASDNGQIWVVLALLAGVGLRAYFLAQPMRLDESYTFINFINRDLKYLFLYTIPNNHVLYSILTKAATVIFGENPVSIRLVAFLAGIALIPLAYRLCRQLGQSGIFASFAVAVLPYFVLYSTNGRGYTLLVLFAMWLALIGRGIAEQPSKTGTLVFSAIAALGLFTMPTMLLPLAGIYMWVLILLLIKSANKNACFSFSVLSVLATGILTSLFYLPVVLVSNGIGPIIANRFVKAQPWPEFISQMIPHLRQTLADFTRGVPGIIVLVTLMLFVIGVYAAIKVRNWPIVFIIPSLIFTSAVIFMVKQRIPFERTWIYIIPFFIIVADAGFTFVTALVPDSVESLFKIAAFSLSVFVAITVMAENAVPSYQDTGTFAEAELVAKYLKPIMSANDLIHVRDPASWPVYFYLWYHRVPQIKGAENPGPRREYYVVQKSRNARVKPAGKQYATLLSVGDLTLYQAVDSDAH